MSDRIKLAEAYERFWNQHSVDPECHCWVWIGSMARGSYGRIYIGGKAIRAHRYSWMYHKGEIPDGMYVCHSCDNPACVNPDHLFLGTAADNSRDMREKGRSQRGERNGSRTKLTDSDILTIRNSSEHYMILAERFDVSKCYIHKIKRKEVWTHI